MVLLVAAADGFGSDLRKHAECVVIGGQLVDMALIPEMSQIILDPVQVNEASELIELFDPVVIDINHDMWLERKHGMERGEDGWLLERFIFGHYHGLVAEGREA